MATSPIDRDKLHVFVRQLDEEDLLDLVDHAIDLLPKTKLPTFIKGYAKPASLRPDGPSPTGMLAAVEKFHAASLADSYYESFNVNSHNYMQMSNGTQTWIAECERLFDRCIAAAKTDRFAETRAAFELLFDLLLQIDDGRGEFIFFADEAGSWQVGVEWETVLPAWFRCLAATATAEDYARLSHEVICYFAHYQANDLIPVAIELGNIEQRAALAALPPAERNYQQPSFTS